MTKTRTMSRFYTHDALNDPIRNVKSSGALLSELDLFSGPATQTEIEGCYWERVHCLEAGLDPTQKEVIFDCKPSLDVVSLFDSYLEIVCRIQKITDTGHRSPTAAEKVWPANNVLYTLWKGNNFRDFRRIFWVTKVHCSRFSHNFYFCIFVRYGRGIEWTTSP